MRFADRVSRISVSQTMAVNEKALQMRAQGIDIADFGAGEPDFPTPDNIKPAGVRAIDTNFTRYTSIGGTPDLRRARRPPRGAVPRLPAMHRRGPVLVPSASQYLMGASLRA